jgi:hypothetical protein
MWIKQQQTTRMNEPINNYKPNEQMNQQTTANQTNE